MNKDIPKSHPRYESLLNRQKIVDGCKESVVAYAGLIAHGRGESFDYLIGEITHDFALEAIDVAVCTMLNAKNPVFSVNGNIAALCSKQLAEFSEITNIPLEINLFYHTKKREKAILKHLKKAGAKNILGIGERISETIPELDHKRGIVDSKGIFIADTVFVPLEDGDRTEALIKMGKIVITVDLNPLSRTAQKASITIVDNIIRVMPLLIEKSIFYLKKTQQERQSIMNAYNNKKTLSKSLITISNRLIILANTQKKI